jgi:hypothetical protein
MKVINELIGLKNIANMNITFIKSIKLKIIIAEKAALHSCVFPLMKKIEL